jgi:hypothetical protein
LPAKPLPDVEIGEQSEEADCERIDIANDPGPAAKLAQVEFGPDEWQVFAGTSIEDGAERSEQPITTHVAFERVDVSVDEFDVFVEASDSPSALLFERAKVRAGDSPLGV